MSRCLKCGLVEDCKCPTQSLQPSGFHWRHGVYFERLDDGSVRIDGINAHGFSLTIYFEEREMSARLGTHPRKTVEQMTHWERLAEIAEIIEAVDNRCMAADGPVTKTLDEMQPKEIRRIYALARGSER